MVKFKRYILAVASAFLLQVTPFLAHAVLLPSENSAATIPAEGNGNCNDYAENGVIMSLNSSVPGTGIVDDGTESATYTISSDNKTLNFSSATVPIDFAIVKNKRSVGIFMYPSGGTTSDTGITLDGRTISSFSLCYGLGNTAINTAPVLATIEDQSALVGDVIDFSVSASDDGFPVPPGSLSLSVDTLGANFIDNGDGTGDFSWTATAGGSTNITFTVTDGELSDSQTIAITVHEPEEVADCAFLDNNELDQTGVSCPADGARALVCNLQLDEQFYGLNINDHCCICNQDPGSGVATPLLECDPNIPAGGAPVNGIGSCFVDGEQKAPLEVTTHLEFNNDPYYCQTYGGRRTCWRY